jgi:carbonic anhydrase
MRTLTKEDQKNLTPDRSLTLLKEGNKRFTNNLKLNRNLLQQVNETTAGQNPFAVIISCMDSRAPAEIIFDQGLGDIFSIRIAGNIINDDIIGSTEFGTKAVGAKIVMVLGHSSCGAINGAIQNVQLGKLSSVTDKVRRCLPKVKDTHPKASDNDLIPLLSKENVLQSIRELRENSPILSEMEKTSEIKIVGGMYDIATGLVDFYE